MPVPLTGAIDLNDIHINAGGSSGTQVSLNDSDVRALANDFSGEISMSQTRGGTTVTQGLSGSIKGYSDGTIGAAYGSIADKVSVNGANVLATYYTEFTIKGSTTRIFFVYLSGTRSQNFFTSFYESSLGTLSTSSSGYAQSSSTATGHPYTYWSWNQTSTPSNWDGSGALKVKFQ